MAYWSIYAQDKIQILIYCLKIIKKLLILVLKLDTPNSSYDLSKLASEDSDLPQH